MPEGQEFAMAGINRRFREFLENFLGAITMFLSGTQVEPRPVPVKARRRR